jgi:3-methyladenine DNA glycosylase AlkC
VWLLYIAVPLSQSYQHRIQLMSRSLPPSRARGVTCGMARKSDPEAGSVRALSNRKRHNQIRLPERMQLARAQTQHVSSALECLVFYTVFCLQYPQ